MAQSCVKTAEKLYLSRRQHRGFLLEKSCCNASKTASRTTRLWLCQPFQTQIKALPRCALLWSPHFHVLMPPSCRTWTTGSLLASQLKWTPTAKQPHDISLFSTSSFLSRADGAEKHSQVSSRTTLAALCLCTWTFITHRWCVRGGFI